MPLHSRAACLVLLLPIAASAQSSVTIGNLLNAETIQLTVAADTTWHDIKLRPSGDCLGFVFASDRRGAPTRSFDNLVALRYRVRGDSAEMWRPIAPAEVGAIRGCARRQAR
jgi:hypothetical protein